MEKIIDESLKNGKAEKINEGIEYIRFSKKTKQVNRGTVIIGNRIIWGFPKIARVFTLEKGLEKNIGDETIYIEEKIDGFNVRIAKINGRTIAFSRGGFIDHFATEKANELKLEKFFSSHPEKVLCGEMIGNTPYTKPTNEYDVKFLVFDIDNGDGSYLSIEEKYKLLARYNIESVPKLGKVNAGDMHDIKRIAVLSNKNKKEGIVIKTADRRKAVKYVNPNSDIEDIENGANKIFDMPSGFFDQRVLRSGMYIKDFEMDQKKYGLELGKAFYFGLLHGLKQIETDGFVSDYFEITIRNPKIFDSITRHMGKEVRLEIAYRKTSNGKTKIGFRKIYKKTSQLLRAYMNGNAQED